MSSLFASHMQRRRSEGRRNDAAANGRKRSQMIRTMSHEPKVLRVEVREGKGLASKNITGKSDCYVKLRVCNVKKRTEVCYRTLTPKWNAYFSFDLTDVPPFEQILALSVWDHDRVLKDEFMGQVILNVASLDEQGLLPMNGWHVLEARNRADNASVEGAIHLRIEILTTSTVDGFRRRRQAILAQPIEVGGSGGTGSMWDNDDHEESPLAMRRPESRRTSRPRKPKGIKATRLFKRAAKHADDSGGMAEESPSSQTVELKRSVLDVAKRMANIATGVVPGLPSDIVRGRASPTTEEGDPEGGEDIPMHSLRRVSVLQVADDPAASKAGTGGGGGCAAAAASKGGDHVPSTNGVTPTICVEDTPDGASDSPSASALGGQRCHLVSDGVAASTISGHSRSTGDPDSGASAHGRHDDANLAGHDDATNSGRLSPSSTRVCGIEDEAEVPLDDSHRVKFQQLDERMATDSNSASVEEDAYGAVDDDEGDDDDDDEGDEVGGDDSNSMDKSFRSAQVTLRDHDAAGADPVATADSEGSDDSGSGAYGAADSTVSEDEGSETGAGCEPGDAAPNVGDAADVAGEVVDESGSDDSDGGAYGVADTSSEGDADQANSLPGGDGAGDASGHGSADAASSSDGGAYGAADTSSEDCAPDTTATAAMHRDVVDVDKDYGDAAATTTIEGDSDDEGSDDSVPAYGVEDDASSSSGSAAAADAYGASQGSSEGASSADGDSDDNGYGVEDDDPEPETPQPPKAEPDAGADVGEERMSASRAAGLTFSQPPEDIHRAWERSLLTGAETSIAPMMEESDYAESTSTALPTSDQLYQPSAEKGVKLTNPYGVTDDMKLPSVRRRAHLPVPGRTRVDVSANPSTPINGDLNERFQNAMKQLQQSSGTDKTITTRLRMYSRIIHIAQDFLFCSRTYGKIIISERFLKTQTISPVSIGGQAGGVKYIVHGILFKFAICAPSDKLFAGNDHSAAKVAGNELKGLMAYFNLDIPGLCFPLMSLLDYKGFRMICLSVLPVGKNTLIYGSADAGVTVHSDDPGMNHLMRTAGERLQLRGALRGVRPPKPKKHWSPLAKAQYMEKVKAMFSEPKVLHAAIDVEGHLGRDGRYYMLDFSRTFPSEPPRPSHLTVPGEHLFRRLRCEFVTKYHKPLCPDAFSKFIGRDPDRKEMFRDVREACEHLIQEVIPSFVPHLLQMMYEVDMTSGGLREFQLSETLHSRGINVRHCGILTHHIRQSDHPFARTARVYMLVEMAARVLKNLYRKKLRSTMKRCAVPLEQPYLEVVSNLFNLTFGNNANSRAYWDTTIRDGVMQTFGSIAIHGEEEQMLTETKQQLRKSIADARRASAAQQQQKTKSHRSRSSDSWSPYGGNVSSSLRSSSRHDGPASYNSADGMMVVEEDDDDDMALIASTTSTTSAVTAISSRFVDSGAEDEERISMSSGTPHQQRKQPKREQEEDPVMGRRGSKSKKSKAKSLKQIFASLKLPAALNEAKTHHRLYKTRGRYAERVAERKAKEEQRKRERRQRDQDTMALFVHDDDFEEMLDLDVSLRNILKAKISSRSKLTGAKLLFLKLQRMVGVQLLPEIQYKIDEHPTKFFDSHAPFEQYHFTDLGERVKTLNIVTLSQGNYMMLKGISCARPKDALMMLRKAESIFVDILRSNPNNAKALRQVGYLSIHIARLEERSVVDEAEKVGMHMHEDLRGHPRVLKAIRFYERSLQMDDSDPLCLLYYGKALALRGQMHGAEDAYLRCLEVNPNYKNGLKQYAAFLSDRGNDVDAQAFEERLRLITTRALHREMRSSLASALLRPTRQ